METVSNKSRRGSLGKRHAIKQNRFSTVSAPDPHRHLLHTNVQQTDKLMQVYQYISVYIHIFFGGGGNVFVKIFFDP